MRRNGVGPRGDASATELHDVVGVEKPQPEDVDVAIGVDIHALGGVVAGGAPTFGPLKGAFRVQLGNKAVCTACAHECGGAEISRPSEFPNDINGPGGID